MKINRKRKISAFFIGLFVIMHTIPDQAAGAFSQNTNFFPAVQTTEEYASASNPKNHKKASRASFSDAEKDTVLQTLKDLANEDGLVLRKQVREDTKQSGAYCVRLEAYAVKIVDDEEFFSDNLMPGAETVVKDVLSPYFKLTGSKDISVKTADYLGNGVFSDEKSFSFGKVQIEETDSRQSVSVKGFSFDENYLTENSRKANQKTSQGKKLIIEFSIVPREGFLGGNEVPVSEDESGVYVLEDGQAYTAGEFEQVVVDVPIPPITIEAVPKNVCLMGKVTDEDYREGALVKCGDVLIFGEGEEELEDWQKAYVSLPSFSDLEVEKPSENLLEDTFYTLSCTIAPKKTGTGQKGKQVGVSEPADILVYQPVITFHDGQIFFGETIDDTYNFEANRYDDEGNEQMIWKHGEDKLTDSIMIGSQPQLSFTYGYEVSMVREGKVNTKEALPVYVTSITAESSEGAPEENLIHYAVIEHMEDERISSPKIEDYPEAHFLLHVNTGSLTIQKIVEENQDNHDPFIFTIKKDGNPYTVCAVLGNKSVTITDLPLGTYEIEEESGKGSFSWRHGISEYAENNVELTREQPDFTFISSGRLINERWLNSIDFCQFTGGER